MESGSMTRRMLTLALAAAIAATPLAQERGSGQPEPAPAAPAAPAVPDPPHVAQMKKAAAADVDAMKDFTQQMVDSVFSFGELGFQEVETNRYLIAILKKHGFTVEE